MRNKRPMEAGVGLEVTTSTFSSRGIPQWQLQVIFEVRSIYNKYDMSTLTDRFEIAITNRRAMTAGRWVKGHDLDLE